MKKIIFILLIMFSVGAVQAAPFVSSASENRQGIVARKNTVDTPADKFLEAVSNGDTQAVLNVQDKKLLRAQDKFGNNCFHLAKNRATLLAIASVARQLDEDYLELFKTLRNQRNQMGETPLMYQISFAKTEMFKDLYGGSHLQKLVREANAVNTGAALIDTANVKKQLARAEASDKSGRTVADAARANGLEEVVLFFQKHAPYLFS